MGNTHCCEMMQSNSTFSCDTCSNEFECPDSLVYYNSKVRTYGIIIHDGGESVISINYCPWCGSELIWNKLDFQNGLYECKTLSRNLQNEEGNARTNAVTWCNDWMV